MYKLQKVYSCYIGGTQFFLRIVLPDDFDVLTGGRTNLGLDYWLVKKPFLYEDLFLYEEKYNFRWIQQLEIMMKVYHQSYSDIMLMPTEERLSILKKTSDKHAADNNEI